MFPDTYKQVIITKVTDERKEEKIMKKFLVFLLSASLAVTLFGCGTAEKEDADNGDQTKTEETADKSDKDEADEKDAAEVLTHAEYLDAELDSEVTVETYVQAKQAWWEDNGAGKATVYAQSEDGAYFIYEMPCSEEEYKKLEAGTKIKVTGYKSEWSGEVEITDVKDFEILDGSYVAEAVDITDQLASEDLINHQNELVKFTDMKVEASDGGAAFLYKYDGSGTDGDDLYFKVSTADGASYTFTVESYLCDKTTEVYQAVKNLKVGDTVDTEGFLYWYEGVNPHITSVTVK